MASKKRQAYREWDTKAIMTDTGRLITFDQITALSVNPYRYRVIVDDIIQQIETIMNTEMMYDGSLQIIHWSNDIHLILSSDNFPKATLNITRDQAAALHDLFQWSRVEKIRQNRKLWVI
jgi:hypothetical protein